MDKSVPAAAAYLLDFIGSVEAPKGYDTVYGNNQSKLPKPLTRMTIKEVQDNQKRWTNAFGSSAAGKYQFMYATLNGLIKELNLDTAQKFSADLQDRLGYHLLRRRGYDAYMLNRISTEEFGKRLAQEWASFPVLAVTKGAHREVRIGESYYAGDKQNKSLLSATKVRNVLAYITTLRGHTDTPSHKKPPIKTIVATAGAAGAGVAVVVKEPESVSQTITDTAQAVQPVVDALSGLAGLSGSVILIGLGVGLVIGVCWWLYSRNQ